jgi:hypothetical protein
LYLLDHVASVSDRQWKLRTSHGGPKSSGGLDKLHQQRVAYLKRKEDLTKARVRAERKAEENAVAIADLTSKIADRLSSVEATKTQHNAAQLRFKPPPQRSTGPPPR